MSGARMAELEAKRPTWVAREGEDGDAGCGWCGAAMRDHDDGTLFCPYWDLDDPAEDAELKALYEARFAASRRA